MEPRFDWKEPWDTVSDAMNKVLDDFGTIAEETFVNVACRPSVALRESATAYELEVSLPGVARDDVDISVEGRRVTVAGAWPKATAEDDRTILRDELARGRFKRVLLLPEPVEASEVSARLAAGILTVTLPLREPTEHTEIPIEDVDVPDEGPASTKA